MVIVKDEKYHEEFVKELLSRGEKILLPEPYESATMEDYQKHLIDGKTFGDIWGYLKHQELPVCGYIFKHDDDTYELWNFQGDEYTGLKIEDIGLCSQTLCHTWNSQRYLKAMQQTLQAQAVCGVCGSQKVSLKLDDKRWGDYLTVITCDKGHTETRPVIGQKELGAPWTCELCGGTVSESWTFTSEKDQKLPSIVVLKLSDGKDTKEFSVRKSHRLCDKCSTRNKEVLGEFERNLELNYEKYREQEKDERRLKLKEKSKDELIEEIIELEDRDWD